MMRDAWHSNQPRENHTFHWISARLIRFQGLFFDCYFYQFNILSFMKKPRWIFQSLSLSLSLSQSFKHFWSSTNSTRQLSYNYFYIFLFGICFFFTYFSNIAWILIAWTTILNWLKKFQVRFAIPVNYDFVSIKSRFKSQSQMFPFIFKKLISASNSWPFPYIFTLVICPGLFLLVYKKLAWSFTTKLMKLSIISSKLVVFMIIFLIVIFEGFF